MGIAFFVDNENLEIKLYLLTINIKEEDLKTRENVST